MWRKTVQGRQSAVTDSIAQGVGYAISPQKAQTDRARLRLGQDGGQPASGEGARFEESGPDVCADDGNVQPGSPARLGTNPCAGGAMSESRA